MRNLRRSLGIPLAAFAAGLAGVWLWPVPSSERTAGKSGTAPGTAGAGGVLNGESATDAARDLEPAPSLAVVLGSAGLERTVLVARLLLTADSADCAALLERHRRTDFLDGALVEAVWDRWVAVDLEAALRFREPLPAWSAWGKRDPDAALAAALEGKSPKILSAVLTGLAVTDPARARRLLAERREASADGDGPARNLLRALLEKDPREAMSYALSLGFEHREGVFQAWVDRDPDAARAWMGTLTSPAERRRLEGIVSEKLRGTDPSAALKEAARIPPGERRTIELSYAFEALLKSAPTAALAALEALPDDRTRQQALVYGILAADAATARALLPKVNWGLLPGSNGQEWVYTDAGAEHSRSGDVSADVSSRGEVLRGLMSNLPEDTLAALSAADPGVLRAEFLTEALRGWTEFNPEAASSWLRDQPAGPARDAGIEGLTDQLTAEGDARDFPSALAWAGEVSPEQRMYLVRRTLQKWSLEDPAAARAAVETVPVTPEQRAYLREQFP